MQAPRRRALVALSLTLLASVLAGAAGVAAPDDLPRPERRAQEVRQAAQDILARPEFRPPPRSIPQLVVDFVGRQLERALNALLAGGRGSLVGWLLLVAALGSLTFFALRIVTGVRVDPRRVPAVDLEPRRPAADWRAEAAAHEARGEWKAALRCRYRALVADLAAKGLVDEVPGRTAGEYRLEVRSSVPGAATDFDGATQLFELAWYGNRPTGEEENRRFRSFAENVLVEAGA